MLPLKLKHGNNSTDAIGLVDSGTNVSIIPFPILKKEFPNAKLQPSSVKLRGFIGENIPVRVELKLTVENDSGSTTIMFIITESGESILYGCDLIESLKLLDYLPVVNNVQLMDLNREDVAFGKIRGHIHRVSLKKNCVPLQQRQRPVPFSMREKVSKEIKRLLDADIIEKVDSSEWISNIVVVSKPNSDKIRMCLDSPLRE